jgi:hypothetical protein
MVVMMRMVPIPHYSMHDVFMGNPCDSFHAKEGTKEKYEINKNHFFENLLVIFATTTRPKFNQIPSVFVCEN